MTPEGAAPSRRRLDTARKVAGALCRALGVIILLVALDWSLGAAWESVGDRTGSAPPAGTDAGATSAPSTGSSPPTTAPPPGPLDGRVDAPALADAPWRFGYFAEFARLRYDYLPFLYAQAATTHGRHINTTGGVRRSYEPAATAPMPELWFFGGSAMWGEGQRDGHTIPSEVARLAEADGLAVHVTNRGERAWVLWQEALLFEQRLAHEPAPDLAVFYDGANELGVQGEHPYPDPTVADFDGWSEALTGRALEPGRPHAAPPPDISMRAAVTDLFDRYRSTSAVGRIVGNIGSAFAAQPAAAQDDGGDGTSEAAQDRAIADIYRRGRSLVDQIAADAGVATMFFWQPVAVSRPSYRLTAQAMAPETIDLTGALDEVDGPVYLDSPEVDDTVHTNEHGARLMAEAMWRHLRPQVEAWYADHPR